jgi:cytochrome c peroxidase
MTRGLLGSGTALLILAASTAAVGGCASDTTGSGGGGGVDGFSKADWEVIEKLSPLDKPPADPTSKYSDNEQAAVLGQMLFMDKAFSGPIVRDGSPLGKKGEREKVACVSCHDPKHFMIDTHDHPNNTASGVNFMIRNAATSLNSSFYKVWCEQDGIRDSQWSDSLTDPEDPTSMGGSRLLDAHVLYAKYKDEYNALFDDKLPDELDPKNPNADRFPPEGMPGDKGPYDHMTAADQKIVDRIFANFGKAVQAYVRKLISKNAPFDKYVAGDHSAISPAAKAGLEVFIGKAACNDCHNTPLFSDSKFHDTGIDQEGTHVVHTETGRFDGVTAVLGCEFNSNSEFSDDQHSNRLKGLKQEASQKGQWRTKQLRNVAMTAPYFHSGQEATLEDVIKFYNGGGDKSGYIGTKDKLMVPLNLTDEDISNLVAFLQTLTGDPLSDDLAKNTAK